MERVVVTGGAGYVGSHVCKELARQGYEPVTYDNLSRGHRGAVRWGPLEVGDLLDEQRLREVLERYRPGGVLHFAALAYVGESVGDPASYYRNNVYGTLCLLDAMRAHGIDQLVFSSTCAVYGTPEIMPISESSALAPINPYGASKLAVERILVDYDAAYGLRSVSLRYFNAAGADLECEIGERHEPETHAIPLLLRAAVGGPPFRIFGTDYPTADGSAVRDYIHVSDLATAHVAALKYLAAGRPTTQVNLGTGNGTSVLELVDVVARVTERSVPTARSARRAGDPPVLVAQADRAQALLGWQARYSSIQQIVASAWRWHHQNGANLEQARASGDK